jgi:diaminohydroxyphosphoribosylaminopyrimidine deaminase/5-amino-6-(5-phosphoribosylamino)uracil reductase
VTLKAEDFLNQMLAELHKRQIQSLLVEGGRELHQLFIDNSLWDEIRVEESDIVLGGGIEAPAIPSGSKAERKVQFGHTITTFRNAE